MSSDFELTVVDVGHGNAAVIREGRRVVVVDTSVGNALILFLQNERIDAIELVVLSHSDADHIGGLIGLLNHGIRIGRVLLNSDASKDSEIWRDLVFALDDAQREGIIEFDVGMYEGILEVPGFRFAKLEVMAPSRALAALGVGAKDRSERLIDSNSISASIRVFHRDVAVALLSGDMDEVSLREIEHCESDMRAQLLVFPHHGGLPGGSNAEEFIARLITKVQPEAVLFSNGRRKFGNPRIEVVDAVRRHAPTAYLGCTQLAEKCSAELSASSLHLSSKHSSGAAQRRSCAGSMTCVVDTNDKIHLTHKDVHLRFIDAHVPTPMCLGRCPS